jgi:hypothetical protein
MPAVIGFRRRMNVMKSQANLASWLTRAAVKVPL